MKIFVSSFFVVLSLVLSNLTLSFDQQESSPRIEGRFEDQDGNRLKNMRMSVFTQEGLKFRLEQTVLSWLPKMK